jgi:broad specificity phosphatase PhoE
MPRLYLIRHGEPTGSWGTSPDPDPGLSELGHQQAKVAGDRLRLLTPKQIVTSPLRRASETSLPLAQALDMKPSIAHAVAEIPSPENMSVANRGDWLRAIMQREWNAVEPGLRKWRQAAIDYLLSLDTDTAVFSHYVLINVAVGAAIGDDRVHCFAPAHASITVLESKGNVLSLVELGATGATALR